MNRGWGSKGADIFIYWLVKVVTEVLLLCLLPTGFG